MSIGDFIDRLQAKLALLRPSQLKRVERLVDSLSEGCVFEANDASDLATPQFCEEFGDVLRQHHNVSEEPFTKDKFEYAIVATLRDVARDAIMAPPGNPGHDVSVDDERWSLKTQADRNIKANELHISKFMELGRGKWQDERDLEGLREAMFEHLRRYERIFSLRCLERRTDRRGTHYLYELVEIPKALLLEAAGHPVVMQHRSEQVPKPGNCQVFDTETRRLKFELYFDGGTERKLQIRKLDKRYCLIHATWSFTSAS